MGAATRVMVRRSGTLLLITAVALSLASCGGSADTTATPYCALMPDTIGLYVGNPVTQMGYPVGEVTSITAGPEDVRVDFSVENGRRLPVDVKAIIRSPSIVADRSLELVGNDDGGPSLQRDACISRQRSMSPMTISEVIGSAHTFVNAINPVDSANIGESVSQVDALTRGNGARAGQLISATAALLDSPDQAISDIGSIAANLAELTTALTEMRDPLKQILLDARETTPDVARAVEGAGRLAGAEGIGTMGPTIEAVATLETRLGDETQLTLDTASAAIRKLSPHANAFAALFDPVPWWINNLANQVNGHQFAPFNIAYRPPMFRVPTHDGLALCGFMNAQMPGSCADVHGQPYAVDVALLQYVLMEASRR
ncbi:MlaD family protein [Mycolicibacterium sp. A43C]